MGGGGRAHSLLRTCHRQKKIYIMRKKIAEALSSRLRNTRLPTRCVDGRRRESPKICRLCACVYIIFACASGVRDQKMEGVDGFFFGFASLYFLSSRFFQIFFKSVSVAFASAASFFFCFFVFCSSDGSATTSPASEAIAELKSGFGIAH